MNKEEAALINKEHPKDRYLKCLRDSALWHRYIKTDSFGEYDMAMWACKDLGCAINYYQQVKFFHPNEHWPGSANAT